MAIVDVDGSTAVSQAKSVGLRALSLRSSNKLDELWQWPRHDDSTINIVISRPTSISISISIGIMLMGRS